ncbi:nucleotidyltransferase family protein [Priestia koreensis]|uniref:nucleotidyltransferase family protein n=1 Tax=Priestia koreensis TaxID=284581 RepID=UPI003CFFD247
MRAVIMAGGKGVRLQPYTKVLPKPLIPLSDIPILEIILKQLKQHGFRKVTLALNYKAPMIYNYFGTGESLGLDISYTYEEQPLGTVGPLKLVGDLSNNEPFLFMNADVLTDLNFSKFYKEHVESDSLMSLLLYKQKEQISLGVVEVNEVSGEVLEYLEKPQNEYLVSTGIYMMNSNIVKYIPNRFFDIPELISLLIRKGYPVASQIHNGIWMDIGTLNNWNESSDLFEKNRDHFLPPIAQTEHLFVGKGF